ncbi:MAG: (d)CMP kinase [Candidatus Latescibacterota bacterium]|nr:(d)CMP kinase [Candidatus Latescibacterota bacterium]
MRQNGIIVAIDGPAGAGKSTTAKAVAERLRYLYLDTGAMYRAVALAAIRAKLDPDSADDVAGLAMELEIDLLSSENGTRTFLGSEDVSDLIRTPEVSNTASRIAVHSKVRKVMVGLQKMIGIDGGIVLEGRDTTTAIFPDAELKVFLEATVEERTQRRLGEYTSNGVDRDLVQLKLEIQERDDRDRETQSRHGSWPSPEAIRLDTTGLSIDEQVNRILGLAAGLGASEAR